MDFARLAGLVLNSQPQHRVDESLLQSPFEGTSGLQYLSVDKQNGKDEELHTSHLPHPPEKSVLETEKCKIKKLADSVSGEGSLPGSQMNGVFSLGSPTVKEIQEVRVQVCYMRILHNDREIPGGEATRVAGATLLAGAALLPALSAALPGAECAGQMGTGSAGPIPTRKTAIGSAED
ncbi:hypothetical protein AAY473_028275 [Plecturocebus cupreus]